LENHHVNNFQHKTNIYDHNNNFKSSMLSIPCLIFALFTTTFVVMAAPKVAKVPVVLDLSKATGHSRSVSKPALFESVLGLKSGDPFYFDFDRWQALQHSGLFKNLTARVQPDRQNDIQLLISGEEQSTITFAPEISAGVSLQHPDISGGVSFIE
jgi:hypothetical protein